MRSGDSASGAVSSSSQGVQGVAGMQQPEWQRQPAAVTTLRTAMIATDVKRMTTAPTGFIRLFPPFIESRMYAAEQMHLIFFMHGSREDCGLCAGRGSCRS